MPNDEENRNDFEPSKHPILKTIFNCISCTDRDRNNTNTTKGDFDYKADLQRQFREILGDDYHDKSIADKMTNRNIRRDRLIERMKGVLIKEFATADKDHDNKITLDEMREYVKKSKSGQRMLLILC